ncbi:J domain-containing protein required for chloroplast accumulation response 1 [Coffea eugenioides]|uniref:J domain-containing protein required for chloroplast accumulation response 1 n=1 Tax=Coffea eugenioides TaxID=49369 RepID=UPI000F608FD7|nr:J domain-containing protein required for chloroplast accumulation response 1 [Coffea eugenioides]
MERFSQRENVLLGYSRQGSFETSTKTSDGDSDMDFSDVFGGPPRRFSIRETRNRYSFCEAREESDEDAVLSRSPWPVLDEKPVFGEEGVNRKSYPSDDFYDDIFKGDEAKSRRTSRDFFASSPGSRISSPSRPLPPKAEPLSTSYPAQFSLPDKLTKATDFPLFGTTNRSSYKNKDGLSNGTSYKNKDEHTSLSRFANQATEVQDEARKDRPVYRQSPLSQEASHTGENCHETKSIEKDMGAKLKYKTQGKEVPLNSGQFHFSIYKWAGSGVPLLIPLGGRSKSRYKENFKTERCSSSNGRIESDIIGRHLPTVEEHIISIDTKSLTLKIDNEKHDDSSNDKKIDSCSQVEETHLKVPEPKLFESEGTVAQLDDNITRKKTEEESLSKNETNVYAKIEKEFSTNKGQTPKAHTKSLHELLKDENGEQGNENSFYIKTTNVASNNVNVRTSPKKTDARSTSGNRSEMTNAKKCSATNSGDAIGGTRVKGKVKEFVKIFNQETTAQSNAKFDSKGSRWQGLEINRSENGMSTAVKTDENVHKLDNMADASSRVDANFNKNKVNQESHFKSSVHKPSDPSTNESNSSNFSDSLPKDYDNNVENKDDSFFLVEDLTHDEEKDLQTSGLSAEIQASNAKIQQWSSGRKGNIRSLLSTLQLVLWPESGWKPVPLVDLIDGSAVKRAYQRALLCLHPDKLQQKGAASHQRFIAEQVFDILQEAWNHFNSLGAI